MGAFGRWLLAGLLVATLAATLERGRDRLLASRIVWQTHRQVQAVAAGQLRPRRLVGAVAALRQAERLAPASIDVLAEKGGVQMLLGRLDAAARVYREALALEPRPEHHLNLGRILWQQGRRDEAGRHLGAAVALDPQLKRHLPPGFDVPKRPPLPTER